MFELIQDESSMPTRDIHVLGASAGGISALRLVLGGLPADLSASVFVVIHLSQGAPSYLPTILQTDTGLRVKFAEDGLPYGHGTIYVAPPGQHLLLERDKMRLLRGPKENRFRPAIDVLFRSAAWACGPRVVGVVLTGMLDDGTAGLWAIKSCGGVTVVQDPHDAQFSDMPANALRQQEVDHCLPAKAIGPLLAALAREPAASPVEPPRELGIETSFANLSAKPESVAQLGNPTVFTCPSCQGALWEISDGPLVRYRCHTGHAFSSESLLSEQSREAEDALFAGLRAIEEKSLASRRIAERYGTKFPEERRRLENEAQEMDRQAQVIRQLLAAPAKS
jgi:two-component system chemotaxis response regulator CheB